MDLVFASSESDLFIPVCFCCAPRVPRAADPRYPSCQAEDVIRNLNPYSCNAKGYRRTGNLGCVRLMRVVGSGREKAGRLVSLVTVVRRYWATGQHSGTLWAVSPPDWIPTRSSRWSRILGDLENLELLCEKEKLNPVPVCCIGCQLGRRMRICLSPVQRRRGRPALSWPWGATRASIRL